MSASVALSMKVGDKIRIVKLPKGLVDDEQLQTKSLFELCLGRVFLIREIVPVVETGGELLELHVGKVLGEAAFAHSIWIESELVELVRRSR
ncbi:hypothetical protein [Candidatus Binatus sp.]|jgi:hypothetical protein|uniref:hypothetical protein n=1 Tax=Candidatus Binatus sp. TaxID=2811406 RepID=UPI003C71618E